MYRPVVAAWNRPVLARRGGTRPAPTPSPGRSPEVLLVVVIAAILVAGAGDVHHDTDQDRPPPGPPAPGSVRTAVSILCPAREPVGDPLVQLAVGVGRVRLREPFQVAQYVLPSMPRSHTTARAARPVFLAASVPDAGESAAGPGDNLPAVTPLPSRPCRQALGGRPDMKYGRGNGRDRSGYVAEGGVRHRVRSGPDAGGARRGRHRGAASRPSGASSEGRRRPDSPGCEDRMRGPRSDRGGGRCEGPHARSSERSGWRSVP